MVNFLFNGDFILEFAFVDPPIVEEAYQTANAANAPEALIQDEEPGASED